jgi:alpha-ketoglutarate-dependent taurine dioxygenase
MVGALGDATDPALWRAASFQHPDDYTIALSDADRREILAARALCARDPAPAIDRLTRADFGFTGLAAKLATAYDALRDGRGFVLLRGLPHDGLSLEQFSAAAWGIGLEFGDALSQNAAGECITHVIDAVAAEATPRLHRSNLALRPHTDVTAMIALACWQPADSGGVTTLTSGVTVHDELRQRAPELLEPLYRGFHYHRFGEEAPGQAPVTLHRVPVFAERAGRISVRYLRTRIAAGHRAVGVAFSACELEALDAFDATAGAPENRLAFRLARGDMVVVNNYVVLHGRTGYASPPEPAPQRRLVRLWLDRAGLREVPAEFLCFATNGVPAQAGRRATLDFRALYAADPAATGGISQLTLDA